jgi:hypothetical protein
MTDAGYEWQKNGRWVTSLCVGSVAILVVYVTVKAHHIVNKRTSRLL